MGSPFFGYLAGFFALLFYCGIIYSILCRTTVPSRATWIIWGINDLLLLVSSFYVGAWNTLWVPLVYAVCSLFCLAASIKNDAKPLALLDKSCLFISAVAWVVLVQAKQHAFLALGLAVSVNTLGVFPTWGKVWKNPQSETSLPWLLVFLSGVSQLVAVEEWRLDLLLFPLDTLLVSGTTLMLTLRRSAQTGRKGNAP